ncbi:DUF3304 domain-containing protein [Duganella sp. Root1480D1]|uniref:DUF3304 domain-containing protein n=1 Tax=Duganella sp. Root1480D1 TaxID=1736471 RepID=UPI0009E8C087
MIRFCSEASLRLAVVLIVGCSSQPAKDISSYGASVGIVNHTGKFIHSASVNGGAGGHMEAWGAGAANVCCVSVPRVWSPGMKLLVRWDMPEGSVHVYKQALVEVEKYDETGSVYIHVLPDDVVRVVVSNYDGWSSKHPIPPPKKPNKQLPPSP